MSANLNQSFGTLTVNGIAWSYCGHGGKTAYWYRIHTIVYSHETQSYHIKEADETVFTSHQVVECLEVAHQFVFDYYAALFVPLWDQISDPFIKDLSIN